MILEDRVAKVLSEQFGVHEASITPDTLLADDLGADSLDQLSCVMALEDEFGIDIPDKVAMAITTVRELTAVVAQAPRSPAL